MIRAIMSGGTYRKSTEQASSLHCSDTRTTFKDIDGMEVVTINNGGAYESTKHLSQDVEGYLLPRESTAGCKCQSNLA